MKVWKCVSLSFLAALAGASLASAEPSTCAKVSKIEGDSCANIKVTVDLSACGGEASTPAPVDQCDNESFHAKAKHKNLAYEVTGVTNSWGGSLSWSTDKTQITSRELIKKTPRNTAQAAATSAPAEPSKPVPTAPAAPTTTVTQPAAPPVVTDKTEFKSSYTVLGDLRHRLEEVYAENPGAGKKPRYTQMRLRARLGVKAQPTEDLALEFRLATSTGGVSTNQTYGDASGTEKGNRNYSFKLDRVSAKWTPVSFVSATVGRMANPFSTAGGNDLVFDADVNLDGHALSADYKFGPTGVLFRGGEFIFQESKDTDPSTDVKLHAFQVGASYEGFSLLKASLIGSLYDYSGIKGHGSVTETASNFYGNSNASSLYLYDYKITSVGLELAFHTKIPVTVFYEHASNSEVDSEDTASIYGVKFNKLKGARDWIASIDMRTIERDSVLGAVSDGDSFGGGANGESLRISAGYAFTKALNVFASYYTGKKSIQSGGAEDAREKTQVDLNFSF